jgi:hypothetical protein
VPQTLQLSGGVATATISLSGSCTFATLVATHDEPIDASERVINDFAAFQAGARPGDVLVAMKSGRVGVFRPDGTSVASWSTGTSGFETGMDFDEAGNLYVTNYTAGSVSKLAPDGTLLGDFGSGYLSQPESIQFDSVGMSFIGHFGGRSIQKRAADGTLLDTFVVAVEATGGSDWIALGQDDCTMTYTSRGVRVLRYDVCTRQQLTDFASVPTPAYGVVLLPDGGALVAGSSVIRRLDAQGAQTTTYDVAGTSGWWGLALDPDGTSFWATDGVSARVYRFSLAGGPPLLSFASGATPCAPGSSSFPIGGVAIVPDTGMDTMAYNPSSGAIDSAPNETPPVLSLEG